MIRVGVIGNAIIVEIFDRNCSWRELIELMYMSSMYRLKNIVLKTGDVPVFILFLTFGRIYVYKCVTSVHQLCTHP